MRGHLILLAVLLSITSGFGAVRQWTNTVGGNWFIPSNWSPNAVPGVLDTANITNEGTYTVTITTGTVAVANLNLGGASGTQTLLNGTANNLTVTNSGIVRANGILSITNGGLLGRFTIQLAGQLHLSGSGNKNFYNLSLINQGTFLWSGGNLLGGSTGSTTISNGGLWQITSDHQIYQPYGGPMMTLTNSGTIQKTGGGGISYITDFNLLNRPGGVVQALTGTLQFGGGTNNQLGGSFTATSPGIINIASGTWFDAGGAASGTGINRFNGGTFNFRTNIVANLLLTGGEVYVVGTATFQQAGAITNLTLDGAQLKGTNRVGSGSLIVNSGGLEGQLTVQPAGILQFVGSANKNVYNFRLLNQGTVAWNGGNLLGGSTASTTISNGGLWQITGDNQIYQPYGGPAMSWTNSGTLRKSSGTEISYITDFNFVNRPGGIVQTLTGTLQFSGGTMSQIGGLFTATAPGLMNIAGGTWFDAGGTAAGTGVNRFNGGTLNLRTNIIPNLLLTGGEVYVLGPTFQQAGAITNLVLDGSQLRGTSRVGTGLLLVNSGGIEGQLTVLPAGTLQFATAANKNVYNLALFNQGTVAWTSGQLLGGSSSSTIVSNGGLWQITGDNQFYQPYGGPPMAWTNFGKIQKSAGTGISHITDFDFFNRTNGIVEALTGTLQFSGGTNNQIGGVLTSTPPGIINIAGGVWFDAGGSASATGTNRFNGGRLNLSTNIIANLKLTGGDVYVIGSTTFQQAGAITNLTLDGSQLKGTNRVGSGTLTINSGGAEGQLTIQPAGTLLFATDANKNVYNLRLFNQGTVNWNSGQLLGGSASSTTVSNGGLWQITGDNQIYQPYGGPQMNWSNFGILRKSGGAGTSLITEFNFVNSPGGIVHASSGMLQFNGGPSNLIGGSWTSTPPGIVNIASGTWFDAGGAASATGTNRFNGGTLNLRTNIIANLKLTGGDVYVIGPSTFQQAGAITNIILDGSQLRGTNVIGNGTLTINSGGVEGRLTVQPAGMLQFLTAANKNVYNLLLLNQGTVTWNNGNLLGGSAASTIISNGGVWQITGDNQIYQPYGGPAMTWTNSGRIQKSGGTGNSLISEFRLHNTASGVIQSDVGTLQLPLNYTNTAGLLRLNGGTLQSAGTLYTTGGTFDGIGTFGANSFSGGTLSPGQGGAGLIGFKSGVNLNAGATLSINGTGTVPGSQYDQLSVTGAVNLAGATLQVTSLPPVPAGTTFLLILNDSTDAVVGTFNGLAQNAVVNVSGQPFRIDYNAGSGNDVALVRNSGAGAPQLANGSYSNGVFRVTGTGANSVVYVIQATTNFLQWTNVGTATGNVSGTFLFTDTNAFRYRYRFYRTTN